MAILPALTRAVPAALLGVLLTAPVALAAGGSDTGERTPLNLPDTGASATKHATASAGTGIVRTIVGLAVVLGVIFGLHWILKQIKSSKEGAAAGTGLSTLATLPLGTNRSLHLVRAGDEVVLVGSGEAGVTAIRTYRHEEARALGLIEEDIVVAAASEGTVLGLGTPAGAGRAPLTIGSALQSLRAKTVIR